MVPLFSNYDGDFIELFVNGELKDQIAHSGFLVRAAGSDQFLYLNRESSPTTEASAIYDDLRIYARALSHNEIAQLWSQGSGDLGVSPLISGMPLFASEAVQHQVSFLFDNSSVTLGGLDSSEVNASNGSIQNFSSVSNSYDLNLSVSPSSARVEIVKGAVDMDGNLSSGGAFEFSRRMITAVEDDLLLWFSFDDLTGNLIKDRSGKMRHGFYNLEDSTVSGQGNLSYSNSLSPYLGSGAFDDQLNPDGRWLARQDELPNVFIRYDFENPQIIGGYRIVNQYFQIETRSPQAWRLEGSMEADANYTTLHTVTNQTDWAEWEARDYFFDSIGSFQYYRFVFTEATGSNTYLGIGEIELYPAPVSNKGLFGKAIDLNGEATDLPIKADQNSDSNGLSFATWFYPREVTGGQDSERMIFSTDSNGWDWSASIRFGAVNLWSGNYREQTPMPVVENDWYHLVTVFNPAENRTLVYLNNQSIIINSIGYDTDTNFLRVGKDFQNRTFNGLIDDVRVWGRPLSGAEVSLLWGNGMGDLGPRARFEMESPAWSDEILGRIQFNQSVSDFNSSEDLVLSGLTLSNISEVADSNASAWDFTAVPNSLTVGQLSISLLEGSVSDLNGVGNEATDHQIDFRPHRTSEGNLVLWWELDEGTGNQAFDSSNSFDPSWTPASNPSNNLIWLDANDASTIIESGGTVSAWNDKSSSGNHLSPMIFLIR